MKIFLKKIMTLGTALVAASALAFADEQGDKIMEQVHAVEKPAYSHSLVEMTLTDKNGTTEVRRMEEYGRNKDGTTSAVMVFLSPASIKNTRFLQCENKNAADDKWIYLPALKSTRRINSSEGSKSFMGTDATYDDLSTRELSEDTHEYIKEEPKLSYPDCYVVKEVPVDKKSSQYSYRMVWVDKKTMYPVYTELYDKNGNLEKVLTVAKIENHDGYNIPMENKMENVQTGHTTQLKIVRVDVTTAIPERVFTQAFLSNGR